MKYRLYGRDGLTSNEFKKLVAWKVIETVHLPVPMPIRKKKIVTKTRFNPNNNKLMKYQEEISGSDSDCYTEKHSQTGYKMNDRGDPNVVNSGFEL